MLKKRLLYTGSIILLMSLLLTVAVFAWFVNETERKARTEPIEIEDPPIIEIGDYQSGRLESLDLDGLQKGTTYQYVFSVNAVEGAIVNRYLLTLIYTDNMKETMTLYRATPTDTQGVNTITYKDRYYIKDSVALTSTQLTPTDVYNVPSESVHGDVEGVYKQHDCTFVVDDTPRTDYFILEISWAPEVVLDTIDEKETDIVYIVAKSYLGGI